MSEYMPKDNATYTRRAINAAIYLYPEMYVELVDGEGDILNGTPIREVSVKSGISNPTEQKAIQLAGKRREELRRKCEAINYCLSLLPPKYYEMVCLRFWGVRTTEDAIKTIRKKSHLRGMNYESTYRLTVGDKVDKSAAWVKCIVRDFINAVGQELGEI